MRGHDRRSRSWGLDADPETKSTPPFIVIYVIFADSRAFVDAKHAHRAANTVDRIAVKNAGLKAGPAVVGIRRCSGCRRQIVAVSGREL